MPQPFSKFSKTGNYVFGNDALTFDPILGALVARAIAGWSIVEVHLGNTFAALIGAKQPAVVSMYAALRSFEAQRDMLNAAARDLLPKRYALLIEATVRVVSTQAKERHRFAHWVWGKPMGELADCLILAEPGDLWRYRTATIRHRRKNKVIDHNYIINSPKIDLSKVMIYTRKDLEKINENMEEAYNRTGYLYEIPFANASQRRIIHSLLSSQPDIATALAKAKKHHQSRS